MPGTVGYQQLILFCNRERTLNDLPLLHSIVAMLRFATISERWIEGRHALVKQSIACCNHVSAVQIAYVGALPLLWKMLIDCPENLKKFAELCKLGTHPLQLKQ